MFLPQNLILLGIINNEGSPELKLLVKYYHLLQGDVSQMATGGEIWIHPSIYYHHTANGKAWPHPGQVASVSQGHSALTLRDSWIRYYSNSCRQSVGQSERTHADTERTCRRHTQVPKAWGWNKRFPIVKLVLPQKERVVILAVCQKHSWSSWSTCQLKDPWYSQTTFSSIVIISRYKQHIGCSWEMWWYSGHLFWSVCECGIIVIWMNYCWW